jgi:hypothetical protein
VDASTGRYAHGNEQRTCAGLGVEHDVGRTSIALAFFGVEADRGSNATTLECTKEVTSV